MKYVNLGYCRGDGGGLRFAIRKIICADKLGEDFLVGKKEEAITSFPSRSGKGER